MMMNQTQKRLQIIKLAISITDIETIQLQVAKLRLLEGDKKIEEIVSKLDTKNYAQAQSLITDYIDTPIHTIHQRTTPNGSYTETEQELIEKFDLFVNESGRNDDTEYLDDIETFARTSTSTEGINYEALLQLDVEDVLHDNVSVDTFEEQNEDDFFAIRKEPKPLETEDIPRDSFFNGVNQEEESFEPNEQETFIEDEHEPDERMEVEYETEEFVETFGAKDEDEEHREADVDSEEVETEGTEDQPLEEPSEETEQENSGAPAIYKPSSSIKDRFHEVSKQYPPIHISEHPFPSVHACLMSITYHTYTDEKIHKILENALKLSQSSLSGEKAEASELILLSSVTEVKFAKLIFARELFKGELFEKNTEDAFDLISRLAEEEYPEALCDLGQFYEHGIGTKKDKKKAKQLYKESMHLGVHRATKHYERLTRGLFSFKS